MFTVIYYHHTQANVLDMKLPNITTVPCYKISNKKLCILHNLLNINRKDWVLDRVGYKLQPDH